MIRKIIYSIVFILFVYSAAGQNGTGGLTGLLWDDTKNEPVAFATVAANSSETNELVYATVSGDDGVFVIQSIADDIYLEINYIGYEKKLLTDIEHITEFTDLGKISLKQDEHVLEEVLVEVEKSTVEFKLDKKVFNVGKDISSTGMGALEVLNNVPSVNVDLEGNITLRGNSGVQILINGKPSVLADEGSSALGSITADMIEKVEIITNPSAKYDAEGTSGIINLVLKKDEKSGINGSVSINTGVPNNHSLGVSLNKRADKFNLFTQFGGGYRTFPFSITNENTDLLNNTRLESLGKGYKHEEFYNITLGSDYYINTLNTLTLTGRFAYEFEDETSTIKYSEYNDENIIVSNWLREELTTAENPKWQFDLQYKKQFKNNEDHILLASAQGNFFGKEKYSEFLNSSENENILEDNQKTETDFHRENYTFKIDYTNPITEKFMIESGLAYTMNDVGNEYEAENFTENTWAPDPNFSNHFQYKQNVLGLYSTLSYESPKWGLKVGLRAENTDLNTYLETTDESNTQKYTDLFPSLHATYKFTKAFAVQAGYSKRIFRPRLWDLNPFFTLRNTYNIRSGNPNLLPQYADSYEITGILTFEKLSLNSSVYHLSTTDVIERVSNFEDGVIISSPMNIGTNKKTGFSIDGKYTPVKMLTLTGDFNFGKYKREGEYNNESFDLTGNQWASKLTSKIKLPADIDLELTGRYHSSVKTVQGEVSAFSTADIGLRKKMLKGKLVLNLSIRDLFETRKREYYVYEDNYTSYGLYQRARFFKVGLSYGFGKGEAMYYYGGKR